MASSSSTTNTSPPPPQPPPPPAPPSTDNILNIADPSNPIGYCHTCDRQVEIDKNSFVCKQCNGGFIELFEMGANGQDIDEDDIANASNNQQINIHINEGDFANLVPNLLSQLLNPAMVGAGARMNAPSFFNINDPSNITTPTNASPQSQTIPPTSSHHHHHHLHNVLHQQHHNNAARQGATGGAGASAATQGPTRFQFIVPGEQVDLYGIINSVFSDVLDPRRQANMQQANNFHFQAPPIRMFQLHGDLRDYAWGATGLDTIITQLLNQLENTGPPPASDDQLKNLPVVIISKDEVEKNVQCAICMEDFNLNDEAKRLPCKHYFHEPCINEWLKLHGTCPVCRKNLNGEDTSQREYIRPPTAPDASDNTNTSQNSTSTTQPTTNTTDSSTPSSNRNTEERDNVYYDLDDFD